MNYFEGMNSSFFLFVVLLDWFCGKLFEKRKDYYYILALSPLIYRSYLMARVER